MRRLIITLLILTLPFVGADAEPVVPLPHAHAHNDYEHTRPLLDALDHGFCSIEVDVWLVEGALLVGHEREGLNPAHTLEALYLQPLLTRVRENEGAVYPDGPELILLIDIKNTPRDTFLAVRDVLVGYEEMLTTFTAEAETTRAVRAVISGGRPKSLMLEQTKHYAGYDGRLPEIDDGLPASFMPLVSASFTRRYPGVMKSPMHEDQHYDIADIAAACRERGYKLRFWATPENESLWTELLETGVDLISTVDLGRLKRFFDDRR